MNRLFVYGVFLSEHMRDKYAMSNPRYTTVRGYTTIGCGESGHIVEAVRINTDKGDSLCLTGLLVDVEPEVELWGYKMDNWMRIDALEAGYDRVKVKTTSGVSCWMYVARYSIKEGL